MKIDKNKDTSFLVRISKEDLQQFEAICKKYGRSKSRMIRLYIEKTIILDRCANENK